MAKDYYAILGVSKNASEDEIKKAFRRLAHEHHPDKGGEDQKFKDINEAYQVLSDKKKRQVYDQFGSAAFENGGAGAGGPGGFGGFSGFGGFDFNNINHGDFGDLGDVLGEMFGFGGGRSTRAARGKDVEIDIELSFREAAFGVEKDIHLYKHSTCRTCQGQGAEPGSKLEDCPTCKGSGQVRQAQRTVFGTIQTVAVCDTCKGRGKVPEKKCHTCSGLGVERREEKLTVQIPPGIAQDEALKVSGQGEAMPYGGRAGDLYIHIRVKQDPRFERDDHTVLSEVVVPFSTLALGGSIEVETLDGKVPLTIPAGTVPGTPFPIRGHGIPYRGRTRGDHIVTVTAEVPKKLSPEQKELLEALKKKGL
jgi:molecular chaperone DnaJ